MNGGWRTRNVEDGHDVCARALPLRQIFHSADVCAIVADAPAQLVLPPIFAIVGYIAAIAVLPLGYQLLQVSNNTAIMMDVHPDRRSVISTTLSLSGDLELITDA